MLLSLDQHFVISNATTVYPWHNSYSISISVYGLRGVGGKGRVQVSKRELNTHIYLNYIRVEFLYCI